METKRCRYDISTHEGRQGNKNGAQRVHMRHIRVPELSRVERSIEMISGRSKCCRITLRSHEDCACPSRPDKANLKAVYSCFHAMKVNDRIAAMICESRRHTFVFLSHEGERSHRSDDQRIQMPYIRIQEPRRAQKCLEGG